MSNEHQYLSFGIPSLDKLLGRRSLESQTEDGLYLAPESDGSKDKRLIDTSVCIIGPDGTGKSLFALHLASDHWRRCARWYTDLEKKDAHIAPKIIYASTDLSRNMASVMWKTFWLDKPFSRIRRLPFHPIDKTWLDPTIAPTAPVETAELIQQKTIQLKDYEPAEKARLAQFFEQRDHLALTPSDKNTKEIAFLDLKSDTSGDDWGFLNKLLYALPTPQHGEPLHMLVIDAIEGLETLVGRQDAFGVEQERRGRIEQLFRAAAKKCHLILVVEEQSKEDRLPEVFVADVVIRLRTTRDGDYSRRSIEIEKVRGQKHTRGEHDFRIRGPLSDDQGKESYSHEDSEASVGYPPDYPRVGYFDGKQLDFLSHVVVFPSLHQQYRRPENESKLRTELQHGPFVGFGIYHLDSMLGSKSSSITLPSPGTDARGLPAGTITTIIGRESTHKSQLSRAFLSMAFCTRYEKSDRDEYVRANLADPLLGQGVAILVTTTYISKKTLKEKLNTHLIPEVYTNSSGPLTSEALHGPTHENGLEKRLILRHMEPHHFSASIFMHMIVQLVEEAKRRLEDDQIIFGTDENKSLREKFINSNFADCQISLDYSKQDTNPCRIRLVIDDWSLILSTYPEIRDNPKFLPALFQYLRSTGVSTLILANHQGNPSEVSNGIHDRHFQDLRSLSDHCLHTWHVSFFDERRVAISLLPKIHPGEGQQIRELRPARKSETRHSKSQVNNEIHRLKQNSDDQLAYDGERLVVDPHFELFSGLEKGVPSYVPLRVFLYSEKDEIPAFDGYLREVKSLLGQIFGHESNRTVLTPEFGITYDKLREFSYLQSESRLDHTLVLQVDEFWADSRTDLHRMENYLKARTVDYNDRPITGEDPFGLFQLTEEIKRKRRTRELHHHQNGAATSYYGPMKRQDFFDTVGYSLEELQNRYPVYKVPYSWDFGFLVCDEVLWKKHSQLSDHRTEQVIQINAQNKEFLFAVETKEIDGFLATKKNAASSEVKQCIIEAGSHSQPQTISSIWDRILKIGIVEFNYWEDAELPFLPGQNSILYRRHHPPDRDDDSITQDQFLRETLKTPKAYQSYEVIGEYYDDDEYWHTRQTETYLAVPDPDKQLPDMPIQPVSWREFLGACASINRAEKQQYRAFDLDMMAVESLSCLVFEVWMSEMHQSIDEILKQKVNKANTITESGDLFTANQLMQDILDPAFKRYIDGDGTKNRYRPRKSRQEWSAFNLARLLNVQKGDSIDQQITGAFRRSLYRTILLLNEVIDIDRISDEKNNLLPRSADGKSVAARHWYSTATVAMTPDNDQYGKVLAGLPGNYTVRGDWFLSVAKGSRSPRLGERAIDLMCSRRGNITRLQTGLGLPVRDLDGPENIQPYTQERAEYWTSLPYVQQDRTIHRIHYRELRALGAQDKNAGSTDSPRNIKCTDEVGRKEMNWFWRSTIESYDTHARIWQRWLGMVFRKWKHTWSKPTAPKKVIDFKYFEDEREQHENINGLLINENEAGKPWWDGFREYDHYLRVEMHPACRVICYVDEESPRYREYDQLIKGLIETLGRASDTEGH